MKLSRRKLRRLIKEACALSKDDSSQYHDDMPDAMEHAESPDVPSPEDYQKVRGILSQMDDMVGLVIKSVMEMAGATCERSTAQAIIDHMQDRIGGSYDAEPRQDDMDMMPTRNMGMIKGPGFM